MTVTLLRPLFLLLVPLIALLWFLPRRSRDRAARVLRSLVFLALVLALAQPVQLTSDTETYDVFVVDRSASVAPAQLQRQHDAVAVVRDQATPGGSTSLVVIGATGAASLSGALDPAQFDAVTEVGDPLSSSSLGAALAAAARQIPLGTRGFVHLFSDGLATDRRWAPAVQQIIDRGVTVHTYDLGYDERDVYPAAVTTRGLLRVGQTTHVDVDVVGVARGLRVRLVGPGGEEIATSVPVDSDDRVTVPLAFEPRAAGFLDVTAEVLVEPGEDSNPDNNERSRSFAVQDPLRVLYLGDRVSGAAAQLGGLLGRGFDLVDGSDQVLSATLDLAAYDLVLLDDRPASLVPEPFQQQLADAVTEQGLGLVFSGGKAAFGTGGYDATPVSTISPVEFVQRTEKRDPSTALAIIIDTSGSMTGTRIELAKQVARLAVRRLKAHDRIGIVEFYGNKHWALPLQSAANKITIDRAIGRMQAIGGTVMMPAIEEAYYGLKNVDTRYKHILVITDAGVETSDYESMLRQITRDGINISTVLVGAQAHNQLLIDLASWGKGRFYSVVDRYSLPEVILKQPSTMKLPAYKTGAFDVQSRGGEGWWSDVDRQAMPALDGYVETTIRDGAEALMEIEGTEDPLLATWRYGLGRVTALMTEPVGTGTRGWSAWSDYGRLLGRVFSRTADDLRLFDYEVNRDDHEVIVTARRTSRNRDLHPRALLLDTDDLPTGALVFRQVAPGQFTARLATDPATTVKLVATASHAAAPQEGQQPTRLVSSALDDIAPELQVDPVQGLDLEGLALASGGAYTDPMQVESGSLASLGTTAMAVDVDESLSAVRLWPALLLLGLLLYLAEITYRRWPGRAGKAIA